MSILNRLLLYIIVGLLALTAFGQESKQKDKVWESEKDFLKYKKADKYKGPDDWYGSYPADMERDDPNANYGSGTRNSAGIQYSPQQIQRDRAKRYGGFDRGGGKGDLQFDPEVERPKPLELPEFDPPDIDYNPPKINTNVKAPSFGWLWKTLLFILIAAALMTILYFIFKNKKPADKKVIVDVENDWNPEVISKTELELRLEEAMENNDYRECVRIYFTFILKELIRKSWIKWKKEKTNHHYVMEMAGKPNQRIFSECVRIYDLVWYGEYEINEDMFELLQPILKDYYQSLEPKDE